MSEEVDTTEKSVMITIKELTLRGDIALKIMRCLKKYEPEIHKELKEEVKNNSSVVNN